MQKIVINNCYGGFGLSPKALAELQVTESESYKISRDDPRLIACIEKLGAESGDEYSSLKIVEIPDDVSWEICEYDGYEWVAESHRTWR